MTEAFAPAGADTFPTGTPRVDLLRPQNPGLQLTTINGLRMWAKSNDLEDVDLTRIPITVDWAGQTITLAPTAEERERTVPLRRILRGSLWRALVDEGGVWCAHPDHDDPVGRHCPAQVDHHGEHAPPDDRPAWLGPPIDWRPLDWPVPGRPPAGGRLPPGPARELLAAPVLESGGPLHLAITTAIHRAAGRCQHPDPGRPIYESDRSCAQCSAEAVLALFRDAHVIHLLRTALV